MKSDLPKLFTADRWQWHFAYPILQTTSNDNGRIWWTCMLSGKDGLMLGEINGSNQSAGWEKVSNPTEVLANATLVLAAPTMLESLINLSDSLEKVLELMPILAKTFQPLLAEANNAIDLALTLPTGSDLKPTALP